MWGDPKMTSASIYVLFPPAEQILSIQFYIAEEKLLKNGLKCIIHLVKDRLISKRIVADLVTVRLQYPNDISNHLANIIQTSNISCASRLHSRTIKNLMRKIHRK